MFIRVLLLAGGTLGALPRLFRLFVIGAIIGAIGLGVASLVALGVSGAFAAPARDGAGVAPVDLIRLSGAIEPVEARFIQRGIDTASRDGAQALIIEVDTPGGLDSSMRAITGAMLAAPVPIVVYVAPAGARAGSAGVFVTMAADVAAMAPQTNIGAAHPVADGQDLPSDERTKVTNDAAAYIRMLATTRHHNAGWAEQAVRDSVSLTAQEAFDQHVIDLVSPNVDDLLTQLDGRALDRSGHPLQLHTAGARIRPIDMTIPDQVLHFLADPNIAYLLLTLGMWALLAELFHPGAVIPGVTGAIALILGLIALDSLPLNLAGLALVILALVLFVIDLKAPTHGVLTASGLISFVLGSMMLFTPVPVIAPSSPWSGGAPGPVNPGVILVVAVGITAFFVFVVRASLKSRRLPTLDPVDLVIGSDAVAITDLAPRGEVQVRGESWSAESDGEPIRRGEPVRIVSRQGLRLTVTRE